MENEALKLKDARNYMKAVVWFDYCIELANCFAKSTSGMTAVRIFHQKCSCLLELGWYDEAHEVLNLAETCSPSHLLNSYFKLKLCILQNKEQDACKVLELFCESSSLTNRT